MSSSAVLVRLSVAESYNTILSIRSRFANFRLPSSLEIMFTKFTGPPFFSRLSISDGTATLTAPGTCDDANSLHGLQSRSNRPETLFKTCSHNHCGAADIVLERNKPSQVFVDVSDGIEAIFFLYNRLEFNSESTRTVALGWNARFQVEFEVRIGGNLSLRLRLNEWWTLTRLAVLERFLAFFLIDGVLPLRKFDTTVSQSALRSQSLFNPAAGQSPGCRWQPRRVYVLPNITTIRKSFPTARWVIP